MSIFSKEDIARIKERFLKSPQMIERIEKDTLNVRRKLYIQKTGLATWSHYFSCPKCGTRLTFDYDCNDHFDCPNCGESVSGEPYLGSWWNSILNRTTSAAFKLALLYVGIGKAEHLDVAKRILLGYADNYCNYEVHGGIPYNNPGRFASQVLSDTDPIYKLAHAYDLLKCEFTEAEREHIKNDLFRPAAEHQIKYLTPQIHNHEVAICMSIAIIGLAIDDEGLIDHALNTKYGLKYQIDNAYLEDNFWFEGSTGYHFYSLHNFMLYEMAAKNTKYSLLSDPHYGDKLKKALLFPEKIHIGNNSTVKLNDGGGTIEGNSLLYEHAYATLKDDALLPFLAACYSDSIKRENSVYALLYGVDSLPENIPELKKENYLSAVGTQFALLHGEDDRYLFFKAAPYGGEHDHYDRLGISFGAFGEEVSPDFGTSSGYGSPLHYGYFKNTASHNTVVIDGENMAPCDTVVNEYRVDAPDDIYLDAETLPPEDYKMLDYFTIKQWSDEAYRGVRMRRVIRFLGKYFIDVFSVKSDNDLKKDYTLRLYGRNIAPKAGRYNNTIASKGAQSYIKNAYFDKAEGIVKCEYQNGDTKTDVYALSDGFEIIYAEGPGNPADRIVSYLLERSYAKCPVYVNVIETYKGESVISNVEASVNNGKVSVKVTEKSGEIKTLDLNL